MVNDCQMLTRSRQSRRAPRKNPAATSGFRFAKCIVPRVPGTMHLGNRRVQDQRRETQVYGWGYGDGRYRSDRMICRTVRNAQTSIASATIQNRKAASGEKPHRYRNTPLSPAKREPRAASTTAAVIAMAFAALTSGSSAQRASVPASPSVLVPLPVQRAQTSRSPTAAFLARGVLVTVWARRSYSPITRLAVIFPIRMGAPSIEIVCETRQAANQLTVGSGMRTWRNFCGQPLTRK